MDAQTRGRRRKPVLDFRLIEDDTAVNVRSTNIAQINQVHILRMHFFI